MKALDFIHALALPNADPIGLAKKMQDDLDHLVKTVQDKSQENYALRQKLEQLDDFARNIHIVKTQHEETLKSYKNDYQNYEKQIKCLKEEISSLKDSNDFLRDRIEVITNLKEPYHSHSVSKLNNLTKEDLIKCCTRQAQELHHLKAKWKEVKAQTLQQERELKELKEAREILAASLQEKERLRKHEGKVFYKVITDTDWIPLGTGHVTVEFKTPEPLPPTEKEVKIDFKTVRGHKEPIQSGSAEVQIIDDPQGFADLDKQVHILLKELKREREDNRALSDKIKSLEEQYSLISSLYNNQVQTIKSQQNTTDRLKALLTTMNEVISESDV